VDSEPMVAMGDMELGARLREGLPVGGSYKEEQVEDEAEMGLGEELKGRNLIR
jgi:hypothetical protein